jgi:acyl-CoA synthetase (AMP-forming)/AMP-acid ligase II
MRSSDRWRKFLPANLLELSAARTPDKIAVRDQSRSFTFRQVDRRANQLASLLLRLGLEPQGRVGLWLPNCAEYYEGYYGVARAGGAHVPVLARLSPAEARFQLADCQATALILTAEKARLLAEQPCDGLPPSEHWVVLGGDGPDGSVDYELALNGEEPTHPEVPVEEDWLGWIRYTSGTTGKPKGSMNTQRGWYTLGITMNMEWGITDSDVFLANGPVSHAGGTMGVNHLGAGASVTVLGDFDPAATLRAITDDGVTNLFMVPTQYDMVLERLRDDAELRALDRSKLRILSTAGAPIAPKLAADIETAFPQAELWEFYSATEAPMMTSLSPAERRTKGDTVGRPRFTSKVSATRRAARFLPVRSAGSGR